MSTQELAEHNIQGPFPNPAKDQVHFNFKNIQGKVQVSIYNLLGEKLFNREIENADGRLTLNLNPLWNGVYLVNFEGDFGKVTRKLLVK
jgi:hypothetical protein